MESRLSSWDRRMNHLPRKAALVGLTLLCAAIALALLRYVWPFVVAYGCSVMLEPFVRFASKGFLRLPEPRARSLSVLLGMLLLFGLFGFVAAAAAGRLLTELMEFLRSLPQVLAWAMEKALPALLSHYERWKPTLPGFVSQAMDAGMAQLGQNAVRWAASLSGWITGGAWNTAASIPTALLSLITLVMSTYYLTVDRAKIRAYLHRVFPRPLARRGRLIRASLWRALLGQFRSQIRVSAAVMAFLMLTLGVAGVRYGAAIGLLIGLADALPVIGAGLFLVPWGAFCLLVGQTGRGLTLLCLYLGAVVLRQILEPRLLGQHLGMYPLVTMGAMYVGYRALGIVGLLGGPILLQLTGAVMEADRCAEAADPQEAFPQRRHAHSGE